MPAILIKETEIEYLPEKLVEARYKARLSAVAAAGLAGIHQVTLSNIERGTRRTSYETVEKLCEIYRVNIRSILAKKTSEKTLDSAPVVSLID